MKNEKDLRPSSGYIMLIIILLLSAVSITAMILIKAMYLIPLLVIAIFLATGFIVVNPNESKVLVLFGKYVGTVKENGFFWINPFLTRKGISLRARNLDSDPIKVNDKLGNPIMIGVVLVWRVRDTFKAAFEVDNYQHFVAIQSESAIRNLAGSYAYDDIEDEDAAHGITLRSGGEEVNRVLEKALQDRLDIAGIEVIESRISYLAYAQEIASAMLQRQQATAIVAARQKIVEGAVGMVEMALSKLRENDIIEFDEEKKAAMVSNLMVVLCSDKSASPVINAGTLHH